MKWAILKRATAYTSGAKRCNLCIMKAGQKNLMSSKWNLLKVSVKPMRASMLRDGKFAVK